MAAAAFMRTAGVARLFNALSGLIEAAEAESDWWVGTIVAYSAHLEHGTRHMRARPYFQPAILRTGRELSGAFPKSTGQRRAGKTQWALMVGDEDGLASKAAHMLERNVKEEIRRKGLIDTGHLRASITAAPSLPRMKEESFRQMSPTATSRRTGRSVSRSDIIDRHS